MTRVYQSNSITGDVGGNFKPSLYTSTRIPSPSLINTNQRSTHFKINSNGKINNSRIITASSQQPTLRTDILPNSERSLPSNFKYIAPNGRWRVRPIDSNNENEIQDIIRLQTEGFHTPNPIPILDSTFKNFFKAEVVSEMRKKLKYNPADRFVSLVVEDGRSTDGIKGLIGVVEVSYIDVKEILQSLEPGTEGFVYIASMAVDPKVKRKGVASAMLAGAERVAKCWNEEQATLHVYQDNIPAIELYKNRGYEIIYQDAPWLAKLAVRPRYLMRKKFDL